MRGWVTHMSHDLRPQHFLFAPHLQTLQPEVDQDIRWESFKKPFAMLWCSFVGFFVRAQYQDTSSLFACV